MSYYPDTDEIRMAYVANHRGDGFGNDAETLGIEFDRWFEYEQKKVAKATEQRIIKLLETELLSDDDTAWQTRDWQEVERQQDQDFVIKEAIALIKGENK